MVLCAPLPRPRLILSLAATHQHRAEKSLILYLVQGPLPLMTVDDTPAGNKGISPVTWNGMQRRRKKNKTLQEHRIKQRILHFNLRYWCNTQQHSTLHGILQNTINPIFFFLTFLHLLYMDHQLILIGEYLSFQCVVIVNFQILKH